MERIVIEYLQKAENKVSEKAAQDRQNQKENKPESSSESKETPKEPRESPKEQKEAPENPKRAKFSEKEQEETKKEQTEAEIKEEIPNAPEPQREQPVYPPTPSAFQGMPQPEMVSASQEQIKKMVETSSQFHSKLIKENSRIYWWVVYFLNFKFN